MSSSEEEPPLDRPSLAGDDADVPLSTALRDAARARRRVWLKAALGVAVLSALGGGATEIYLARKRASDRASGAAEAAEAEEALLRGDLRVARKRAEEARALAPESHEVAMTFVRALAFDVLDGDGGKDAGVALLAEARRLGARGSDLAFASLAAAVGVKNDRLVDKILAEHAEASLPPSFAHTFAVGAGLDLTCGDGAAPRYAEAEELSKGKSLLASVRRARALLFEAKVDEARAVVAKLPKDRREAQVLAALADRVALLAGSAPPGAKPAWVDPAWVTELPRSLRTLATAMALTDPNAPAGQSAGLDAALDDVDSPLAALLAGRIALLGGDRVSAEAAAAAALRMREELVSAKVFAARLALVDGDLARAKALAGEGPDKEMVLTVQAIEAYERGDVGRIREIDAESTASPDVEAPGVHAPERWFGLGAAEALLSGGPPPKPDVLDAAIAKGEPWAELLAVDAALASHDVERAKKIALGWAERPPTDAKKLRKKRIESPDPPKDDAKKGDRPADPKVPPAPPGK